MRSLSSTVIAPSVATVCAPEVKNFIPPPLKLSSSIADLAKLLPP